MPAEDAGAELRRRRAEGATLRELAELSGLSIATVWRVCRGGGMVDPSTQDRLAAL
jgi:transcriptional regulator with XRE-family HTH domain